MLEGLDQVRKGLEEGGVSQASFASQTEALNGARRAKVSRKIGRMKPFASSETLSLCFLLPLPELAKGSIHQDLAFHRYSPETTDRAPLGQVDGQCGPRISSAHSTSVSLLEANPQAPLSTN